MDTIWGQKETVGYLALFLRNTWVLEDVVESAYIATMSLGFHLIKDETNDPEFLQTISDFENDPIIIEKINLFFEAFKMKDGSW